MIFDDLGKCELAENTYLYENDFIKITSFGNVSINKYNADGTDVDFIFADHYFDNQIALAMESGITLDVKEDFELVILTDEKSTISITDIEENVVSHFKFENENFIQLSGKKGLYKITGLTETIIKALLFNLNIIIQQKF